MISGGWADKDILPGSAAKEPVIPLHLFFGESNKFTYRIKTQIPQFFQNIFFIADIGGYGFYSLRQFLGTQSSVQYIQFPSRFCKSVYDRTADRSGSANDQCSHFISLRFYKFCSFFLTPLYYM